MPTVWRIVTARFAEAAFSGEGARLYGGRWNPKGVAMVYTAQSQSLALLEMLVQDQPLRAHYVMIPAYIPDDLAVVRVGPDELPPNWREPGSREHLQKLGADWIASGRSAVLAVPSVVVPAESNFLLNPSHPDFSRITPGEPVNHPTNFRLLARYRG
jgi:RES domain-containing protein